MYIEVKTLHLLTVSISVTLYLFRFLRYYSGSVIRTQPKWLKRIPHINDTLLLFSGVALISITRFIPFTAYAPWLSYKLAAIVLYILCGFGAMNVKTRRKTRWLFFVASIYWLWVIITLALTKQVSAVL